MPTVPATTACRQMRAMFASPQVGSAAVEDWHFRVAGYLQGSSQEDARGHQEPYEAELLSVCVVRQEGHRAARSGRTLRQPNGSQGHLMSHRPLESRATIGQDPLPEGGTSTEALFSGGNPSATSARTGCAPVRLLSDGAWSPDWRCARATSDQKKASVSQPMPAANR
jgi:hypothetical protein